MTRRIVVAIVGVVAGALIVTFLGMTVLVGAAARRDTRRELVRQVVTVARAGETLDLRGRPAVLTAFRATLKLQDVGLVHFGPAGRTVDSAPDGVDLGDLPVESLRAGDVVSGHHRSLVFAAAGYPARGGTDVVVLTRHVDVGRRGALAWFVLASLLALIVAAVVARSLGRRLTEPVRLAAAAADRVARGDLSARLPVDASRGGDELSALASSINDMASALERSRGLERQFLLSVSHDLRTPLTSIRGYAEAIAEGTATDVERAAGVIVAESRRLERLVGDLLELAKLDARRFSLDTRPVDVGEVVGVTASAFPTDERDLALTVDAPAAMAMADPDRVAQVVANLIENARKYAATSIAVAVASAPGHVVITVDDDGPGIALDELAHVFERFYRSARTPARQSGTGLGLAIVHELVTAMGGAVRAEASPMGGARVVVILPAATAAR